MQLLPFQSAETFFVFSYGHAWGCTCRFAFSRRDHNNRGCLQTFHPEFLHSNRSIRGAGRAFFIYGISNSILRGPVLPHRVGSSFDNCHSESVSTRHVCLNSRRCRGARAGSLLVRRSIIRKAINQNTARTGLALVLRTRSAFLLKVSEADVAPLSITCFSPHIKRAHGSTSYSPHVAESWNCQHRGPPLTSPQWRLLVEPPGTQRYWLIELGRRLDPRNLHAGFTFARSISGRRRKKHACSENVRIQEAACARRH